MPEEIARASRAVYGRAIRVLAVCLLSGCAATRAPLAPAGVMPGGQVLLKVPFFPDDTDQCGPSALASVLGYWEKPETPERLRGELYRAHLKGSLTIDLLLAAGHHGLSAEMVNGSLARVRGELDAGRPVIVFVNLGFRSYPVDHYMVITGYDDPGQCIFAHSGMHRDQKISYGKFDKQWKKNERWALLISPPRP